MPHTTPGEGVARGAPLSKLRLQNVRCFVDAVIPLHERITVVIGGNGAGKTTLAEALASLSQGGDEGLTDFPLRDKATTGSIMAWALGDDEAHATWAHTGLRTRLPSERPLFAYGRYRRVRASEVRQRLPPGLELLGPEWSAQSQRAPIEDRIATIAQGRRTTTLFRPDNDLLQDLDETVVWFAENRDRNPRAARAWETIQAAIQKLGESLERVEVIAQGDRRVPGVVRRGRALPLDALSDGFQSVLAIVFDLVIRYLWLAPSLADPTHGRATVLIDEVDLHLHPRWQRQVIGQLADIFPETQFVLTTHSPAVVQAAIDMGSAKVGVVVLREESDASVVAPLGERARRRLVGAQTGSILVEDALFDLPSRYSPQFEALEDEAGALRAKVEGDTATAADRRRLLTVLERLEGLLADEEGRRGQARFFTELARSQMAYLKALTKIHEESHDSPAPKRRRRTR